MKAPREDRAPFILLAGLVFGYVIARAILVPITNDECTSFLAYAQPGTFLPFASMWDANNHYLSTALGMLGYRIMGFSWFALRWASVLAFVAYAWGVWRMGSWSRHRAMRWTLWCALLLCPLLLDFFALYRGYAIALAGTLIGLEAVVRYTAHGERSAWRTALIGLLVANLALLAWISLWGLLLALLAIVALKRWPKLGRSERWSHLLWWVVAGAIPFTGMLALAIVQHRLGLLYHGSIAGFVPVTIGSLSAAVLGSDTLLVRIGIVLLFACATAGAVRSLLRSGPGTPLVLVAGVLIAELTVRILAALTIGLPYPEDRTGMHLVLLLIVLLAFAWDGLVIRDRRWLLLALPLWYLPLRTMATANAQRTVLWPEQSLPERFVYRARSMEQELGRPVVVGTHRLAGHTWSLQARRCGFESDASALDLFNDAHDLRVVDTRFLAEATPGFAVVDSVPANGLYLLLRETPLLPTRVAETRFSFDAADSEVIEVCTMDAHVLRYAQGLADVRGTLLSEVSLAEVRVTVVITDSAGTVLHNDLVFLGTRRERWSGERWRILRPVPLLPSAHRLHVYFWDPCTRDYAVREGHLVLFHLPNADHIVP